MNTEQTESKTIQALTKAIEREAKSELEDIWQSQIKERLSDLSNVIFGHTHGKGGHHVGRAYEWYEETREDYFHRKMPEQIEAVTSRVVSSTRLSTLEKKA